MNYFEFVEPYYALIKAKTGEESVEKYIEVVSGEESDFESLLEECELVPEYYASTEFRRSIWKDGRFSDSEDVIELFKNDKSDVLLIDGGLL